MSAFDKYRKTDEQGEQGLYFEGCPVDDELDLVVLLLGFCGCGNPEEVVKYLTPKLEFARDRFTDKYKDGAPEGLFSSRAEREFFWQWADAEGYMEHGGCVPGWLTPEGEELLAMLLEIQDEQRER